MNHTASHAMKVLVFYCIHPSRSTQHLYLKYWLHWVTFSDCFDSVQNLQPIYSNAPGEIFVFLPNDLKPINMDPISNQKLNKLREIQYANDELDVERATNNYENQWWSRVLTQIYVAWPRWFDHSLVTITKQVPRYMCDTHTSDPGPLSTHLV